MSSNMWGIYKGRNVKFLGFFFHIFEAITVKND
jgi:hypothetical protein